ncbi:doublesex- and mab-3-related transcription factor C1-like isoform X1 [Mesocricetus auratus]|uniref:Doublesex- and mab-3-related transcription factor C1-like isoform X1 n=1 Tax=Mesocricetus auratus TaxID=10036 RepID=A0ABM2X8P7_MESAU|nr:doublesex- and mab-3-related transcription factor C1-like isoform X1 [Mesocricetus auratus]XP_040597283.1 doublesex- and mab-3-related transcription factor C1-like isoform X1 [Mesocricetus auratus]
MAVAPKFYKHGKKLTVEAENRNGKEKSTEHKSDARSHKAPQEQGNSQGTLMRSQVMREHSVLPYAPATLEQKPVISFSRVSRGLSARPKRFSSVILQPRATPGPLLLQPQVPNATKQDSVVAALEWQRKLEAAEALLALKNSCQLPPDSASLQQHGSMPAQQQTLEPELKKPTTNTATTKDPCRLRPPPTRPCLTGAYQMEEIELGPAGERELQPSPYLPPQPASSVSLTGHLECMSFLT